MAYATPSSAFTAVRRHFEDPRVQETVRLTITADVTDGQPVRMTVTEARQALYGPEPDPGLAAAIWRHVLDAARVERTPHGPWQLLVIWLALPRLTGAARRICGRLGLERADVEAELIVALLEGLRTADPAWPHSSQALISAAHSSAWRFARARLREKPSAYLEGIAEDGPEVLSRAGADDQAAQTDVDVVVDRAGGPEGLHASLRFRIPAERLREAVVAGLADGIDVRQVGSGAGRARRSRRVGTLALRPSARQR